MRIARSRLLCIHSSLLVIGVLFGVVLHSESAEAQVTDTFEVTTLLDSGPGSLRTAIESANASTADTKIITFDVIADAQIDLASPLPDIADDVTIDGRTATNLTVDGGVQSKIFHVGSGTTTIHDLGLANAPLEIGTGTSLTFDTSTNQQFDDVITDAGQLIKDGAATLTLRGANDYMGGTLVREGTLRGDTTSLQGGITNSALVVFDQDTDDDPMMGGGYAGVITGTGAVQKTGTGVVIFSGANTYAGGTTISEGALQGDASSLQDDFVVEDAGTVIFNQPMDGTYAGDMSGSGDFIKDGAGTLTLTGMNTLTGQASLDAGFLQGGFASIPLNLSTTMGTGVTFTDNTDGTYAGSISGNAAVSKTGTGTLTFSGTHTYSGMTTVSGGTLIADPLKLPNQVMSSIVMTNTSGAAALIFDAGVNGTYQGDISGNGTLTKIGNGSLSLTGDHTFAGPTSITSGRLDVDGSFAMAVNAGVNVGASAVLGGMGTIDRMVTVAGRVAPGMDGSVAPGNSIGTLSVDSVVFAPTSVFEVEVDGSGMADLLAVTTTADLGGASVEIDPGAGSYAAPVNVTILSAGSISGTFASFGPNFAFLDVTPTIGMNSVDLSIVSNGKTLASFAKTQNQLALSTALDAARVAGTDPDIDTVYESLNVLLVEQVPGAIESMTGENLTQFATTRLAAAERFGHALGERVLDHQWATGRALIAPNGGRDEARGPSADSVVSASNPIFGVAMLGVGPMGAPRAEPSTNADSWIRTWIDGSAIYGDVDGSSGVSDFDYNIWGGSLGADVRLAENWILGLAGGYARTNLDFSSNPGDGDVNTYQGALYAGYVDPRFHVDVSGRYAYNDMEGKRDIRFGAINRKATADLDGHDFGVRGEAGLNLLDLGGIVFQPTASINYNRLTQDEVTESGAMSLNLAIEDSDLDSLVTGVGMRVHGRWEIARDIWIVPELRGRWLHEFLDTDRLIEARLAGSAPGASAFQIQGAELSRDAGSVGLAWSVITNSAWSIIGSYDAVLNGDLVQHTGSITLGLEW